MIEGSQKLIAYTPLWMQKYTKPNVQIIGLVNTDSRLSLVVTGLLAASTARSCLMISRSAGLSHLAVA
ncbi:hypothetical protein D3C77_680320 [compost metagenome]